MTVSSPATREEAMEKAPTEDRVKFPPPKGGWVCFHCGEKCVSVGAAELHFGSHLDAKPGCIMKLTAGETGLLQFIRDQEEELRRYRAEETASYREFYALGLDHARKLIAEEQKGYDKGLSDARAALSTPRK